MDKSLSGIVEYIVRISEGRRHGFRLPPERSIAEALNENRATLRESLARLETFGFLKRTQGNGTYLRVPGGEFPEDYFEIALRLGYISTEHVESAREMLEIQIADAAARNATEQDIQTLEYFIEKLLRTRVQGYALELDTSFHLHLGNCAHNPVIEAFLESLSLTLRQILRERRETVARIPGGIQITDQTHVEIFEAVKRHDPDGARKAMTDHFRKWREYAADREKREPPSSGQGDGGAGTDTGEEQEP